MSSASESTVEEGGERYFEHKNMISLINTKGIVK